MIRRIVKLDGNTLILTLPEAYEGKEIEVIAFAVEEISEVSLHPKDKKITVIDVMNKDYKFSREELHER